MNEESASTSEILAGALHDNGRAILVGHKTFGKGKIQVLFDFIMIICLVLKKSLTNLIRKNHQYISFKF